jgi:hypothetical protein
MDLRASLNAQIEQQLVSTSILRRGRSNNQGRLRVGGKKQRRKHNELMSPG